MDELLFITLGYHNETQNTALAYQLQYLFKVLKITQSHFWYVNIDQTIQV